MRSLPLFLLAVAATVTAAKLVPNYYSKTWSSAEQIRTDVVSQKQLSHPTTAASVTPCLLPRLLRQRV